MDQEVGGTAGRAKNLGRESENCEGQRSEGSFTPAEP